MKTRLSLLMFLLYAAPGIVIPLFPLHLQRLGFSPWMIGLCCATQAMGSLFAPLVAGQVADRWVSAEKCLAACSLVTAAMFWLLGNLTEPISVFACSLGVWLVMAPMLTLSTSICFANLTLPSRDFGPIRLWGTIGWVGMCWFMFGWLRWVGQIADMFRLASILALAMFVYACTLPRTPPRREGGGWLAPLDALRLLKGQAFLVYAICTFGICVVLPFHSQLTPLLLAQSEVPQAFVPLLLTVAQLSELVTLATMPRVISRLGPRRTMRLGLIAAVITFVSLMIGRPLGLALTGLGCYGLIISCYLVAGQVYLNQRASDHVRSSAQALHSFLCGSGLLAGNILAGKVRAEVDGAFAPTYALSAALALGLLAVFVAGFPNDKSRDAPVE